MEIAGRRIACLRSGLLLLRDGDVRMAAMLRTDDGFDSEERGMTLEALAPERDCAAGFVTEIRALMHERNVYRGRVLEVTGGPTGVDITVRSVPEIPRESIVLPPGVLDAIERHTVRFADHADALRAAGLHLKRGLLLHGPPGTGKTLSAMHLAGRMHDRTVFLLAGSALYGLTIACEMARALTPAMVVLEDVDLVAEDREFTEDENPILFELLNQMDGIAQDADIIFLLTTNRPQVLEYALAARPGRVDQAVELPLPDGAGRRRLLEIYGRGLEIPPAALEDAVARTEGVSPAYIRELVRRGALAAAAAGRSPLAVAAEDLDVALRELEQAGAVTKMLLGSAPPRDSGRFGDEPESDWDVELDDE